MKILQVSRQFFPSVGGIERVVYGLSQALQQAGHRSDVVTLQKIFNTGEIAAPKSQVAGIQVYRLPHVGSRRYPVAPAVLSLIPAYDVVHIHAIDFFVDYLNLTRFWHRKPLVISTHGGIFHTRWLWLFKRAYFQLVTRFSLSGALAILCDSQHDFDLFQDIVPLHKLQVVPNGVEVQPFLEIKKKIKSGSLLGIGRIVENKGLERLIEVLAALMPDFPEMHLIWVGDDPQQRIPRLIALARQLGVEEHVEFVGHATDDKLLELLSQAQAFVSAASYEAFGVSTIEAMSSGTVPIVTPVGIHPEVIQDGQTGFLCRFDDRQAIACFRHVLSLEAAELSRIGQQAREAAKRYAWDCQVKSYLDVYRAVTERSKHVG